MSRLHGVFGSNDRPSYADTARNDSKPFDPRQLTYEVFGPPGTVALISYFDVDGEPRTVHDEPLPWSLEFDVTATTAVGSLMAQGDSNSIGCRIKVDDEVKTENVANAVNALTTCLLKSA